MTILVAIDQSEFIYYFTGKDSDGDALNSRCSYRVEGGKPESYFWTLTAYNSNGFLEANAVRRFGVNSNDMPDEKINVRVAHDGEGAQWLPVPKNRPFNLTMRLYLPEKSLIKDLAKATMPTIKKERCA
jgi:hypothetical protein